MQNAMTLFLTTLRNKNTHQKTFRDATHALSHIMAQQALDLCKTRPITVETPLQKTVGVEQPNRIVLLPVLRSGIAMLPAFLHYFPNAPIGLVGYSRDEQTSQAHHYYTNLPQLNAADLIIILEPMIATGGTALATVALLLAQGVLPTNIMIVSMISCPEGTDVLKAQFPGLTLVVGAQDIALNDKKFIVPGLGDFGDRF